MPTRLTKTQSTVANRAHPNDELTGLLQTWADGDPQAQERLFDLAYPELKEVAAAQLRRELFTPSSHASELVGEVYLRLNGQSRIDWQCRTQFFALAATFIRRILVDRARSRSRIKRGADAVHVPLEQVELKAPDLNVDLLALDQALTELALIQETTARVVELRFFAGQSVDETARTLGLSRATVVRKWRFAKAWLAERLTEHA